MFERVAPQSQAQAPAAVVARPAISLAGAAFGHRVPEGRAQAADPALPSRRVIAALTAGMLLAGIGVGVALPSRRRSALSDSARSALTASLLAAAAAERSAGAPAPQAKAPASAVSTSQEPTASSTQAPRQNAAETHHAMNGNAGAEQEAGAGAAEGEAGSVGSPSGSGSPAGSGNSPSGSGSHEAPPPVSPALLSQITHVWVIVLSGGSFEETLNHRSLAPYLAGQLVPKGALLTHYSLVAGSPLANDIALLSGQGPNPETERGCPTYDALAPAGVGAHGLATGSGCLYPASVQTLADQVQTAALSWRAYLQDMAPTEVGAQGAPAGTSTCRHPQPGGPEPIVPPSAGHDYLLSRNPFVYFDSLIESQACTQDDVDLSRLKADLAAPSQTPGLSWIVPAACDDGSGAVCGNGAPSGLAGADAFLREVVPQILATAAYREHGLILITFDASQEAASHAASDTRAPTAAKAGEGQGRRVGALIVSPFVRSGTRTDESFNTYSLLKSLERLFGVPLLGHASEPDVAELGGQVYRSASNTTLASAAAARGTRTGRQLSGWR